MTTDDGCKHDWWTDDGRPTRCSDCKEPIFDAVLVKVHSVHSGRPAVYSITRRQLELDQARGIDPVRSTRWYGRQVAVKFENGWRTRAGTVCETDPALILAWTNAPDPWEVLHGAS